MHHHQLFVKPQFSTYQEMVRILYTYINSHYYVTDSTKLEKVKSAFHSNPPTRITCREKEIDCLQSFLLSHIGDHVPGSLYISGPPGTGKTATLMYLLDQHKVLKNNTELLSLVFY